MDETPAAIIAIAFVVGMLALGGVHVAIVNPNTPGVWTVNRFTGEVKVCLRQCRVP
jgi:hypothetical protein